MQPPRALWVSFPLGRPLGKPGDAAFQLDVIRAALGLFDRSNGPVLQDYPVDLPAVETETAAACPVSFAKGADENNSWKARLGNEFAELEPWYELSCRRRGGRTLVGIEGQPPRQNMLTIASYLDDGVIPKDVKWLKQAIEDIKAYYVEAMIAQPGEYDRRALHVQFWQETSFGAAILKLYHQFHGADDVRLKMIARIIAPREALGAATGPVGGNKR